MHRCQSVVYVVDDDSSVRKSLALLLMANGFKAETFSCATEFMACKHPRLPSCLLLDVLLPDISGPILQETMAAEHLDIPIIFITGHGSIPMGVKAMKKGAVDFLTKPFSEKELLDAVERALARSRNQNETSVEKEKISSRIKTLSPRELEVFQFVARGMLNKQIASRRGTALQTIKVHRSRVMRKMHAKTITELISFARQAGIVSS